MHGGSAAGPVSVRREADEQADWAHEKDLQMQAFSKAADGIRTHDLLHGKQYVAFRMSQKLLHNIGFRAGTCRRRFPAFTAKSREFPD